MGDDDHCYAVVARGAVHADSALEDLSCRQVAHQSEVSVEKIIAGKLAEFGPANLFKDLVFQLAFKCAHFIEAQLDDSTATVLMPDLRDLIPDIGIDSQLLFEFALQRIFRLFAGFDFSAGELPLECHWLVWSSLANQDFAIAHDKCS